jgi:hypothetical protein
MDLGYFQGAFAHYSHNQSWKVRGFLTEDGYVLPIDTDTKVLSSVFERIASPIIRTIAQQNGYVVENSNQTTYPDFTLSKRDAYGTLIDRIAIDIKTTYMEKNLIGTPMTMLFTLGSYTSFLQNGTKNIRYDYASYTNHWVIGFVYSRNSAFPEYSLDNQPLPEQVYCPYELETIFISDKIGITGLRAGSGNTTNIGSIKTRNVNDFHEAKGPFTKFSRAKEACDYYWKNYNIYVKQIANETELLHHSDFQQFR